MAATVLPFSIDRTVRRVQAPGVAKMVRSALKAAFPATVFSVRSQRYAGGSSVNIRYTDGPTVGRVNAIVSPFRGAHFDGSDDSTHYAPAFLHRGEWIETSCSIDVSRDLSPAFSGILALAVSRFYGLEMPAIVEGWIRPTIEQERACNRATGTDWGTAIYRASHDRGSVVRTLQLVGA